MSNKLRIFFLALLWFGAAFVRLYRIAETQTFLEDEGRDLLIAKRMIDTKLPVLLGPQTSTGNMYLGPVYYYLITPALIISGGNPVGPAILIAITGVITVYLLYRYGKKWFGELAGWIAAALYALLPYPAKFTRNSWNPNLVPLVMLGMLISASQIKLGQPKFPWKPIFIFGFLAGIMMQLHYMALIGVGSLGVYILVSNIRYLKRLLSAMLIGLAGMLCTLFPFILFEIRNQFVNSKALIGFLTGTTENNIKYNLAFSDWLTKVKFSFDSVMSGQLGSQAFHPETLTRYITISFLVIVAIALFQIKRLSLIHKMLFSTLAVSFFVIGFYQEYVHLHYLGFMLPLLYLTIASVSNLKLGRYIVPIFSAIIILYNGPTLAGFIQSGPTHQVEKASAIADYIATQAGDRPYNVVSRQLGQTSPFQYFLALKPNRPSNLLEKTLFVICETTPCNQDDETTTLLYLTGPSHPALASYLGHPQLNEFRAARQMINVEHVKYGVWVAEIEVVKE